MSKLIPSRTIFFVCDIQTRFRTLTYGFEHVVATGKKMLKLAKILEVPVIVTEQKPQVLGSTVPELDTAPLGELFLGAFEKTAFSMVIPPVLAQLKARNIRSVVLFGIESHICVLQTALDLRRQGYDVYVLADGVSSANREEVPIAIERMRMAGVQITTSESATFEMIGDASEPDFRHISRLVKEELERTTSALQTLLPLSNKL